MEWYKTSKKPSVSYKFIFTHFIISAWWLLCHCSIAIAVFFGKETLMDYTRTSHRPAGLNQPNLYQTKPSLDFVCLTNILMHPLTVWHFYQFVIQNLPSPILKFPSLVSQSFNQGSLISIYYLTQPPHLST